MASGAHKGSVAAAVAAAVLLLCTSAAAQSVARSVAFDDFGFTEPIYSSARAAALGGAYVSSANDVHSLVFNPAGLARVKRFEAALGLQQERVGVENTFFGTSTSVNRNDGGIETLAFAVPLPTYRGSFVLAFGVYRVYSGHLDLHYQGTNTESDNATDDDYFLQQTGSLYSYNLGVGVDLSPTLSGGLSLFVIDGTIDVLAQYDYAFVDPAPVQAVFVTDESSFDVDGYGARVGTQFYFHPLLRAALTFQTPTLIRTNGAASTEVTENVTNGIDVFSRYDGVVDIDYVLPFRFDVGVTSTWRDVSLSLEMGYADWTEASIDRRRLRGSDLDPVFKEVVDYRAGVEWVVAPFPLRLRAGYAHRPYPLRYLQGDRIDGDTFDIAAMDNNRHVVSFGAGTLVGRIMTIDAAYERTAGARSLPTLTDDRITQRYLLSASYRF